MSSEFCVNYGAIHKVGTPTTMNFRPTLYREDRGNSNESYDFVRPHPLFGALFPCTFRKSKA